MNNIKRSTAFISPYLQGPVRLEGESFEDYKERLKLEKQLVKIYLRGEFHGIKEPANG